MRRRNRSVRPQVMPSVPSRSMCQAAVSMEADVASRKVLAHRVAITLEAIHAREVIEQALARHGAPEIVNTDHGSQFTAVEFTMRRWARAASSAWTSAAPGGTTSLWSACGAA